MSRWAQSLACLGFFFILLPLQAQRLGLLPPTTNWQQLTNDSLRIIYPEGNEATARRVASLMMKFAAADPIARDSRYAPISVLLQPYTNVSNGYVGLAPYVSEFYIQPNENPFELGSLPWTDLLAIHEYRHVQQVNAVNTSISHIVKVIFGDIAFSGMYGLATSNWLREGDAVYAETKWTPQGRGRLSRFTLPFREKCKEPQPWNYYQLRNGSYKKYLPDHYPLGYLMVQYGNHAFGENTWDTIFRVAPKMKPIYDPFSGVTKRYYGKSNRNLYLDAMKYYGAQWNSTQRSDMVYDAVPISVRNQESAFFDMNYPDAADSSIYCVITTFDSIATFFQITPEGHRERILSTGLQQDTYFDYSRGRLVWTELRFDPRWIRQDQNVIVVYDMAHHRKMDIVPEKGYYTPSLDPTGTRIVALHVNQQGEYALRIVDAEDGHLIHTLPNPENQYVSSPIFSHDGIHIVATARNQWGQMALIKQNIITGDIHTITPYTYAVIGKPAEAGAYIYAACGIGDLDQIYAIDSTGSFYQVSEGGRAHYNPTYDPARHTLVCEEYMLQGKKLVYLPLEPSTWQKINIGNGIPEVAGASGRNLLTEPATDSTFSIRKYSPWSDIIHIHSWLITANEPVWGVELRSDDIMSSTSIAAGYNYNRNNKVYGPYFDVRFGMWYPQINVGYRKENRNEFNEEGEKYRSINEEVYAGVVVPLEFTPGPYLRTFQVSSIFHNGINRLNPAQPNTNNLHYNYISNRIVFINARRRAHRQPLPSWGQHLDISYAGNISNATISQWYARADLAFPSIAASNYILLTGEVLQQNLNPGAVQLNSRYAGARGYYVPDDADNYRVGLTYGFPLVYPDFGLGNILYMRRIRLQPFYDFAYTSDPTISSGNLQSAGVETLVDFQFANLTLGFRYARLLTDIGEGPNRFEFFIPSLRF